MSKANKFFKKMIDKEIKNLHTCMPCRVESYSESEGTCDIVPLFMKNNERRPLLVDVPVKKWKYRSGTDEYGNPILTTQQLYLEKGDTVLVVFSERELDVALQGKFTQPSEEVKHSLDDAIAIGVL